MSDRGITYTFEPAPIRLAKEAPAAYCKECKIPDDHSWWCSIAPQLLPNGKRPYYWRD